MGSQTLEILRQGVWASLTGGWFYDPHQDVFCNTFHLYLWLFLLCLPFTIYVYFPPTKYMWYFYCGSVAIALTIVKLLNYSLHHMYDTTDCIQEEVEHDWQTQATKGSSNKDDEGIELQILSLSNKTSVNELQGLGSAKTNVETASGCFYEPSMMVSTDVDSLESGEFTRATENASVGKQSSTIDLKAEVHRKNSSESSEELSQSVQPVLEIVSYHSETALPHQQNSGDITKHKDDVNQDVKTNKSNSKNSYRKLRRNESTAVTQEQEEQTIKQSQHKRRHSHFTPSTTTSAVTNQQHQQPTTSSTNVYPSHLILPLHQPPSYRHIQHQQQQQQQHYLHPQQQYNLQQQQSNTSGSVELGYIDGSAFVTDGFYFDGVGGSGVSGGDGVRRIRSTALETCCGKQGGSSGSMMTVHPNSLEFIGAYMKSTQKQNPLLPPPSTRLVRNQHVLWPYYGSEIVYPIAEQSDEQQQSMGADTDTEENNSEQYQQEQTNDEHRQQHHESPEESLEDEEESSDCELRNNKSAVKDNRRLNVSRESTTTTTGTTTTIETSDDDEQQDYDEEDADEDGMQGSRSPLLIQQGDEHKQQQGGKQQVKQLVESHFDISNAETASATSKDGLLDGQEDDGRLIMDNISNLNNVPLQYAVDSVELIASKYSHKGSYNSNSSLDMDLVDCCNAHQLTLQETKQPNENDQASGMTKKPIPQKPKRTNMNAQLTQSYPSDIANMSDVLAVNDNQQCDNSSGAIRKQRNANVRKGRSKHRKSSQDGAFCAQGGSFRVNKAKQNDQGGNQCSSLVELDLDWLFDDENEHLRHCKEPLKRENEWSHSIPTVSLEQDVAKVLQEDTPNLPTPSASRSLGAIPKKLRNSMSATSKTAAASKHKSKHHQREEQQREREIFIGGEEGGGPQRRVSSGGGSGARVMKSESERCCRRKMDRHMIEEKPFNRNRSVKEGKRSLQREAQQHVVDSTVAPSTVTGLECLLQQPNQQYNTSDQIQQQPRLCRLSVSRRSASAAAKNIQQHRHHHHHHSQREQQHQYNLQQQQRTDDSSSPSSGSNHELSSLLPTTQPLLQAFLASRRDFPMLPICLPAGGPTGLSSNASLIGPGPSAFFGQQLNSGRNSPPPQPLRPANSLPHGHLKRSCGLTRRSAARVICQRATAIENTLSAGHGTHCAKSFNDTSDGAVHCFVDEHGNLVTYTFDEKGLGTANTIKLSSAQNNNQLHQSTNNNNTNKQHNCAIAASSVADVWDSNSTESICNSSTVSIIGHEQQQQPQPLSANLVAIQQGRKLNNAAATNQQQQPQQPVQLAAANNRQQVITQFALNQQQPHRSSTDNESLNHVRVISCMGMYPGLGPPVSSMRNHHARFKAMQNTADTLNNNYPRTKSYYKFKLSPWTHVKVSLDRLKLLALLDRNLTLFEAVLSIVLGVLVAVFGALMLHLGFYRDFSAFAFCFVMASCQYSLLKSVQPDAASPTHGFNKIVAYSRPIYFCLVSVIILVMHLKIQVEASDPSNEFLLYGVKLTDRDVLILCRDFFHKFILYFPLLFSLGLFPQINTFVLYLFEQLDMHVFGGNAMSSLSAAFYCIFRSFLSVIVMYGLVFGALSEPKSSQHILFSMFCACVVSSSYHLSRSVSDPTHVWNLLKKHLWPPDLYRERHRKGSNNQKQHKTTKEKTAKEQQQIEDESEDVQKSEKKDEPKDASPMSVTTSVDPLPHKLHKTVNARLTSDCLLCGSIALLVFGIHCSTVFTVLQPELNPVLWGIAGAMGFFLHYIVPQLRKQLPWLCIARPILRSQEYDQYQIRGPAKIMWFERVFVYLCFIERNVFYPLLFVAVLTEDAPRVAAKFGVLLGSLIVVICGMKSMRSAYSNQSGQYVILTFTALFFKYDYSGVHESFLIDYAIMAVVYHKTYEFLLKIKFVVTYIAPWQITWGSAFHAFAQPFSVPHSAMLFLQALISSVLSTPLNPFLGSAIFLTSYVRPVKFWERDYNTRRVDHSNTPLSAHLERNLGADDNNLNSIFYEHLTRSLQHSLCGDLILGRWGRVAQGDCFVLASDYLNCLVHIIEMGNGLVTFQMRGLEFRGTYCQQREVEAITEGVEENDGCCCCDPGHLPNMLSINAAFSQRWLAWEVTAAKYILEGYSISDNSAVSLLQVYDFRKVLITYYVKSIIFYCTRSKKIEDWLLSPIILKALQPMQDRNFVDLDPVFNFNIDEDYDLAACGMTRTMFFHIYGEWIGYCAEKTQRVSEYGIHSTLVMLCFALSLLGRRTLGAASHNIITSVEFFLYGLHALFKGDFRITCSRDEWVFGDMDLLRTVVAPGVRMSLKLHQDHFMSPDEYVESTALYEAILRYEEELVISHEGDPTWRSAVLSGTPSLLALRHVLDEGTDEYKIIMLNKRYLSFRVIKVNRECVRGLWAGQQQELVYLRNRNPERGSIQNAKQALRNIINSSCDQPIGYPIYVSPLTTSYAETNEQLCSLIGGSVSLGKCRRYVLNLFRRIRKRCGEGCSSGGSAGANGRGGNGVDELGMGHEGVYAMTTLSSGGLIGHGGNVAGLGQVSGSHSSSATLQGTLDCSQQLQGPQGPGGHFGGSVGRGTSLSRSSLGGAGNRGSLASMGKPTSSTLVSLAGLFKERDERGNSQPPEKQEDKDKQEKQLLMTGSTNEKEQAVSTNPNIQTKEKVTVCTASAVDQHPLIQRVKIVDPNFVYDCINLGRRIDVCWPSEYMRARGGRSHWRDWLPEVGMEGQVVHRWSPCHKDPNRRSHVDRTILLLQIEDRFVPIAESGVSDIPAVSVQQTMQTASLIPQQEPAPQDVEPSAGDTA